MKHTVHSRSIEAAGSTTITYLEHGRVDQATDGFRIYRPSATQAPDFNGDHLKDEVSDREQRCPRTASRSEANLGGGQAKRKYEDMTSSRIDSVETPENDHELSSKFSFFRENKKKRPPEAADINLMQVEETKVVQTVQSKSRKTGRSTASRSDSASRVVGALSPEICGGSDLTAENHMAEESSRSSNNGASSMLESAAESVAKGSSRDNLGSSVSSVGVLHSFLEQSDGDRREVRVVASSEGHNHPVNILAGSKNKVHHIITSAKIRNDTSGRHAAKLEPAESHQQFDSIAGVTKSVVPEGTTNASQGWGKSSTSEWLQLGLGFSGEAAACVSKQSSVDAPVPLPESRLVGEPSSFRQDASNEERVFTKRKITPSTDLNPVAALNRSETDRNYIFHESSNVGSTIQQWHTQARRSSVDARESEVVADLSSNLTMNPATALGNALASGLVSSRKQMGAVVETVPSSNDDADKLQDSLCLFGSSIRPQLVLAPATARSSSSYLSDGRERPMSSLVAGFMIGHELGFESHPRDQEDVQHNVFPGNRNEPDFANAAGIGGSQLKYNQDVNSITPAEESRLRSAMLQGGMTDHGFQFHRDNRPSSLSTLMQTGCDQLQSGYSWLQPPPDSATQKLIPLAKNFQGWSSDQSTSKSLISAHPGGTIDRHSNTPNDQQVQRAPDEWGSLFRRVSPKMLFQSQCPVDQGGSSGVQLRSSSGVVDNSTSHASASNEAQENLLALKRAIESIQKRPGQWNTCLEVPSNLGSVASWCLNGKALPGVRSDQTKLESVANAPGERPVLMAPQQSSERARVHSRLGGDPVLNSSISQRQSWQPATGQCKLDQGNANAMKRPSAPSTVGKPKFQLLPPGSREANHAGLWFILQSAENQLGEGGLPQISKAYLRIKDGKMPVSAVKKYLVTKLGLSSESEVEITCKGQPVVPSLPLQHVRDNIWFSSLNGGNNKDNPSDSAVPERTDEPSAAENQSVRQPNASAYGTTGSAATFSKDILMVLTYRRHPRTLLSALMTT